MKFQGLLFFFLAFANMLSSQTHWEAIVRQDNIFNYYIAKDQGPGEAWRSPNFDDSAWLHGVGGIGLGDDDDNTIIERPVKSLYLRHTFELTDTMSIVDMMLYIDYDDGFIAYLNGEELARSSNVTDEVPAWNTNLTASHEAGERESYYVSPALLEYGKNTLAIQIINLMPNSSDLSSNVSLNAEVLGSKLIYNEPSEWFVQPGNKVFESHLPIIKINTRSQEIPKDDPRIEARMGVMNNGDWNVTSDSIWEFYGRISIEKRGHSSNMFPKKSYSLETQSYKGENFNVSLLGMPKENDWVLYAPYSDKTMMRNVLAYHLGNATGRWSPRTAFCELVIDDVYQGVYVLTEKIKPDKNRLDIAKLKPEDNTGDELTGGYILKADWPEKYWNSMPYKGKSFKINYYYPSYDNITNQQNAYIRNYMAAFEDMLSGTDFSDQAKGYLAWIDVNSFIDYQLLNEFSKNTDSYMLSSYFYKNIDSKGGKLTVGPLWDYNLAFGNCHFRNAWNPVGWTEEASGDNVRPFWYARLMEDPYYRADMKRRWNELRESILNEDYLYAFIDEQVAHLGDAIQRNDNKWKVIGKEVWPNKKYGSTYSEDIDIMKDFVAERIVWMDEQIAQYEDVERPIVASLETQKQLDVGLYPNPTSAVVTLEVQNLNQLMGARVYVIGINGEMLQSAHIQEQMTTIDISAYADGFYLIKLVTDTESQVFRVMKQ